MGLVLFLCFDFKFVLRYFSRVGFFQYLERKRFCSTTAPHSMLSMNECSCAESMHLHLGVSAVNSAEPSTLTPGIRTRTAGLDTS